MSHPGRMFIFGLGYSAGVLARHLMAQGWQVAGTSRTEEKRAALAAEGIDAHLFDRDTPLDPRFWMARRIFWPRCRQTETVIPWWTGTGRISSR